MLKNIRQLLALRRERDVLPLVLRNKDTTLLQRPEAIELLRAVGAPVCADQVDTALDVVRVRFVQPQPADVVAAGAVALLRHGRAADARDLLEGWLSEWGGDGGDDLQYDHVVELYTVHTLATALGDFNAAREFLRYNEVLSRHSNERLGRIINQLERLRSSQTQQVPKVSHPPPTTTTNTESITSVIDTPPQATSSSTVSITKSNSKNASSARGSLRRPPPQQPPNASTQRRRDQLLGLLPGAAIVLFIVLAFWFRRQLAQSSLWKQAVAPMIGLVSETAQMGLNPRI